MCSLPALTSGLASSLRRVGVVLRRAPDIAAFSDTFPSCMAKASEPKTVQQSRGLLAPFRSMPLRYWLFTPESQWQPSGEWRIHKGFEPRRTLSHGALRCTGRAPAHASKPRQHMDAPAPGISSAFTPGRPIYIQRRPCTSLHPLPCEIRPLPLDCRCNSGVNRQYRRGSSGGCCHSCEMRR